MSAVIVSIMAPLALAAVMSNEATNFTDLLVQALLLSTFLPLLVLSTYIWASGKGAMLIAGYNTTPRAVRNLYDQQALAKFVGMLMTVSLAIMLVSIETIFLSYSSLPFWTLMVIGLAVLFGGVIFINKDKRFLRKGLSPLDMAKVEEEWRSNKDVMIAVLVLVGIVVAVILIVAVLISGAGSVSASVDADGLHVSAPMVNERIAYENITSIELRSSFDEGQRVGGFGGSHVQSGNFRNSEFGRYLLAEYTSVPNYIVVHYSDRVLVFNLDTAELTLETYDQLLTMLPISAQQ